VRLEQVEEWLRGDPRPNGDEILAELRDRLDEWQAFGAALCRAFLAVAERPRGSGLSRSATDLTPTRVP